MNSRIIYLIKIKIKTNIVNTMNTNMKIVDNKEKYTNVFNMGSAIFSNFWGWNWCNKFYSVLTEIIFHY